MNLQHSWSFKDSPRKLCPSCCGLCMLGSTRGRLQASDVFSKPAVAVPAFPWAIPPAWSFVETFLFSSFLDPFFSRYISNTFFLICLLYLKPLLNLLVCVCVCCDNALFCIPDRPQVYGNPPASISQVWGFRCEQPHPAGCPSVHVGLFAWCLVWPVAISWVTGALAGFVHPCLSDDLIDITDLSRSFTYPDPALTCTIVHEIIHELPLVSEVAPQPLVLLTAPYI